jgi:hypothetical protein
MPSSVVATFAYEPETSSLLVTFVSGMKYRYLHVPEEIYLQMKASGSKGKFLNTVIKGHYPFEKAEETNMRGGK